MFKSNTEKYFYLNFDLHARNENIGHFPEIWDWMWHSFCKALDYGLRCAASWLWYLLLVWLESNRNLYQTLLQPGVCVCVFVCYCYLEKGYYLKFIIQWPFNCDILPLYQLFLLDQINNCNVKVRFYYVLVTGQHALLKVQKGFVYDFKVQGSL